MARIYVAAARAGLLLPFEASRPGEFIGHRRARPDEIGTPAVVASAPGGHDYVVSDPPFVAVEETTYYRRAIMCGDAREVSAAEAEAYILDAVAKERAASAPAPTPAPIPAVLGAADEESDR